MSPIAMGAAVFGGGAAIVAIRHRMSAIQLGAVWPSRRAWIEIAACVAVVIPVYVIAHIRLHTLLYGPPPFGPTVLDLLAALPPQFVLVAACEELFFRGAILGVMIRGRRAPGSILAELLNAPNVTQAALFALAHLFLGSFRQSDVLSSLSTFFPALLFGALRVRHESLAGPIILHTLGNLVVLAIEGRV